MTMETTSSFNDTTSTRHDDTLDPVFVISQENPVEQETATSEENVKSTGAGHEKGPIIAEQEHNVHLSYDPKTTAASVVSFGTLPPRRLPSAIPYLSPTIISN